MVWVFFVFLLGRFGQLQDVDLDSVDPALRAGFKNPFQPPFFFGLEKFASVLFFFFLSPFCYLSNNIICTIAHMVVVKLKYGRLEMILASFIPMKTNLICKIKNLKICKKNLNVVSTQQMVVI